MFYFWPQSGLHCKQLAASLHIKRQCKNREGINFKVCNLNKIFHMAIFGPFAGSMLAESGLIRHHHDIAVLLMRMHSVVCLQTLK